MRWGALRPPGLADAGMVIDLLDDHPQARARLDQAASGLDDVTGPVVTRSVVDVTAIPRGAAAIPYQALVVHRPGQEANVDPPRSPLATGDVLVLDWVAENFGLGRGDDLLLRVEAPGGVVRDAQGHLVPEGSIPTLETPARVAGTYPLVPTAPATPEFWCDLRSNFRLQVDGHPPLPPVVLAGDGVVDALYANGGHTTWVLRPDPADLTRDEAQALATEFGRMATRYAADVDVDSARSLGYEDRLTPVVERAEEVSEVVARAVAPVRVTAAVAAGAVLVAVGLLIARQRQAVLRLLALRGVGPVAVGTREALRVVLPAFVGAAAGFGLAVLAVRTFGPVVDLEPRVVRQATLPALAAWLVAVAIVGIVTGFVSASLVDARPRPSRRLPVPWEVVPVAVAIASFLRLDQVGGVRLVGARAQGGDVLAQAFPLLLPIAVLAVAYRPLRALLRRWRLVGAGLPPGPLLDARRVVAEPGITVA